MFRCSKFSPPSHFFFMRKSKNIIINMFKSVVKKHCVQTFTPISRSQCIFKNSSSRRPYVLWSLQSLQCCSNHMQQIAILQQLHATIATLQRSLQHCSNICDVAFVAAISVMTQKFAILLPKGGQSGVDVFDVTTGQQKRQKRLAINYGGSKPDYYFCQIHSSFVGRNCAYVTQLLTASPLWNSTCSGLVLASC